MILAQPFFSELIQNALGYKNSHAAHFIYQLNPSTAMALWPSVVELYQNNKDEETRLAAAESIYALVPAMEETELPILFKLAKDEDSAIRSMADAVFKHYGHLSKSKA